MKCLTGEETLHPLNRPAQPAGNVNITLRKEEFLILLYRINPRAMRDEDWEQMSNIPMKEYQATHDSLMAKLSTALTKPR